MYAYKPLAGKASPSSSHSNKRSCGQLAPSPFWLLLVVCCGIVFVVDVLKVTTFTGQLVPLPNHFQIIFNNNSSQRAKPIPHGDNKGFLVKTAGCRIPEMQPYDAAIKKYIFAEKPVICNNGTPALFEANRTGVNLIESSLEEYKIDEPTDLKCCYRVFTRVSPKAGERDKQATYNPNCTTFANSVTIHDEFVRVECSYHGAMIYKDYFSFVPIRKLASDNANSTTSPDGTIAPNILIIGLDAISRLNFHRTMPKTVRFLHEYDTVELLGYNKVADNTFPNLIPVLTGYHEKELTDVCWPNSDSHFDNCSFVWDEFKRKGYRTAFGEDSAWMGLFNYARSGFQKQPTDYFWDHFNLEAERNIGNNHRINVYECVGARIVHTVLLDYINKFVKTMQLASLPYFGLFWQASLSHDILNKPQIGDDDYYWLLKNLHDSGDLNNTVLIVMSDHGIRWGGIRSTFQGRMEERLPFVFIGLPGWIKDRYPHLQENLKSNIRHLTTPFDLHETLLDFVRPIDELTPEYLEQRNEPTTRRSFSLLGQINENRSCDNSGIPPHFCTCQNSVDVSVNDTKVQEAAQFSVSYINGMLIGYGDCIPLVMVEVINARMLSHHDDLMQSHNIVDYTISLRTSPGDAMFEATVRRSPNATSSSYHYSVTGTISRINLYGSQSLCVTDFHLKLYCFCRQFLKRN